MNYSLHDAGGDGEAYVPIAYSGLLMQNKAVPKAFILYREISPVKDK